MKKCGVCKEPFERVFIDQKGKKHNRDSPYRVYFGIRKACACRDTLTAYFPKEEEE